MLDPDQLDAMGLDPIELQQGSLYDMAGPMPVESAPASGDAPMTMEIGGVPVDMQDPALAPIPPDMGAPGDAQDHPLPAEPVAPGIAQTIPPPDAGAPMTIPGAIREGQRVTNTGTDTTQLATANAEKGVQSEADIEAQEANALAPTLDHQKAYADHFATFQERVIGQYQAAYQKREQDYATTQHELDAVRAQMHPTDIFGAAGVDRVWGTIGMILGAIGGANDGRNAGVERLDEMAKMRTNQLQQEANLIGKKGEMQENMFSIARQKLGDDQGAYLATYQAQLEAVKAEVQQVSNNFRGKRSAAKAQQTIAALDMKLAEVHLAAGQWNANHALNGATAFGQQETQRAAMSLSQQAAQRDVLQLEGFQGAVAKDTHKDLAKEVGGARATIQLLDGLRDILEDGGATPENIRSMMVDQALLIKAAKDYMNTGAVIDKTERSVIEALASGKTENLISMLTGPNFTHQVAQMDRTKRDITLSILAKVRGGNPGVQMDTSDPIWGPIITKEIADQQGRAQRKAARGVVAQGVPRAGN